MTPQRTVNPTIYVKPILCRIVNFIKSANVVLSPYAVVFNPYAVVLSPMTVVFPQVYCAECATWHDIVIWCHIFVPLNINQSNIRNIPYVYVVQYREF